LLDGGGRKLWSAEGCRLVDAYLREGGEHAPLPVLCCSEEVPEVAEDCVGLEPVTVGGEPILVVEEGGWGEKWGWRMAMKRRAVELREVGCVGEGEETTGAWDGEETTILFPPLPPTLAPNASLSLKHHQGGKEYQCEHTLLTLPLFLPPLPP
jgi:hypothetical protein